MDRQTTAAASGIKLRQLLLWVVILTLVGGATFAVLSVLLGGNDVVIRMFGTMFVVAIASGLMFKASGMMDHPQARAAGVLSMVLISLGALTLLFLIWGLPNFLGWSQGEERLFMTFFALGGCGVPAVLAVRGWHLDATRTAAHVGVALVTLASVMILLVIWLPMSHATREPWLGTGFALISLGLPICGCLIGLGVDARKLWRWLGVIAGIIALALALTGIWFKINDSHPLPLTAAISTCLVVAHANLIYRANLPSGQRWVIHLTAVSTIATALLADLAAATSSGSDIERNDLTRLASAAGIVAAFSTLILILLHRLNRRVEHAPVLSLVTSLSVTCPGCSKVHTVALPDSACPDCRMRFHIRVEEPHCSSCHYLLLWTKGENCPECGTRIDDKAPLPEQTPVPLPATVPMPAPVTSPAAPA